MRLMDSLIKGGTGRAGQFWGKPGFEVPFFKGDLGGSSAIPTTDKFIEIPNSCDFSDYFESSYYPEDILNYFGYGFEVRSLNLPS